MQSFLSFIPNRSKNKTNGETPKEKKRETVSKLIIEKGKRLKKFNRKTGEGLLTDHAARRYWSRNKLLWMERVFIYANFFLKKNLKP